MSVFNSSNESDGTEGCVHKAVAQHLPTFAYQPGAALSQNITTMATVQ